MTIFSLLLFSHKILSFVVLRLFAFIEFNEHIYKDWAKYADAQGKNYAESDRLLYYELAKKMAVTAREVWQ